MAAAQEAAVVTKSWLHSSELVVVFVQDDDCPVVNSVMDFGDDAGFGVVVVVVPIAETNDAVWKCTKKVATLLL